MKEEIEEAQLFDFAVQRPEPGERGSFILWINRSKQGHKYSSMFAWKSWNNHDVCLCVFANE